MLHEPVEEPHVDCESREVELPVGLVHLVDYVRTESRGQDLVVDGPLEVLPGQVPVTEGDSEFAEVVVQVGNLEEV